MKNEKFKELPIPTIYRIINSAITSNRETADINSLFDFIVESTKNLFILFKFIELDRLSKDNPDEFIKFIDEQEESTKRIYLEYIPFCNFSINGNEQSVSLFCYNHHSAAISNKGEVIFINRSSVQKPLTSRIKSVCLPDGEKAVSIACCDDSVAALRSNGRVF